METPKVYLLCDANCRWEGMTKEQILTAIAQAVETGEVRDIDTGFIQTIKTINGVPLQFFVGEQAIYDGLTDEQKKNLFAIITDDKTKDGILDALAKVNDILGGTEAVGRALQADNATKVNGVSVAANGNGAVTMNGTNVCLRKTIFSNKVEIQNSMIAASDAVVYTDEKSLSGRRFEIVIGNNANTVVTTVAIWFYNSTATISALVAQDVGTNSPIDQICFSLLSGYTTKLVAKAYRRIHPDGTTEYANGYYVYRITEIL